MGPYYWLMDQLGVPDWVAQRLWLGSISFAAGIGVLWLLRMLGTRRVGAIAGAARLHAHAVPARVHGAALGDPAAVGRAAVAGRADDPRARTRGGWRDPALFALVVLADRGRTNASVAAPRRASRRCCGSSSRCCKQARDRARCSRPPVASARSRLGVSLWWAVGPGNQARYGIPVLDVTESLRRSRGSSTHRPAARPRELVPLRARPARAGGSIKPTQYRDRPGWRSSRSRSRSLALVAAAVTRWRHRAYFVALVVVGTIVGVGAWPYDDPSPIGSVFKTLAGGIGRSGSRCATRRESCR